MSSLFDIDKFTTIFGLKIWERLRVCNLHQKSERWGIAHLSFVTHFQSFRQGFTVYVNKVPTPVVIAVPPC